MWLKLRYLCSLDRLENPLVLPIVGIVLGLGVALPINALVDPYLPDALVTLLFVVLGFTCIVTAIAGLTMIVTERKTKREFVKQMDMMHAISRKLQEIQIRREEKQ